MTAGWPRQQIGRLFELARPPWWAGAATVMLGLAGAILEGVGLVLFIPLLQSLGAPTSRQPGIERLLRTLFASVDPMRLTVVVVLLLCLSIVLKNAVNLANMWLTRYIDGEIAHRVRGRIFAQTLSSCIDYRAGVRRADIATTMSTNSWKVSSGVTLAYRLVVSLLTAIVFVVLMLVISLRLTIVALGFFGLVALVVRFATRRADATGRAVVEENKQFGLRMWESLQSLQLIRAFGRENFEQQRLHDLSDLIRRRLLKLDMLWAAPGSIAEISVTCLIGLLILAAHDIGIGVAALAGFLSLLYRLQGPVRELLQSRVALDSLAGSIDDVDDLLQNTVGPHLIDGIMDAPPLRTAIEFEHVSFRYASDGPLALDDVSFAIPAGRTTAIVGESGAGKSTMMALLFRFQDPTQGLVTADGVPLTSFTIASWRARLALMSQEVQLFNDSIDANIGYGRIDASERDIRAAAEIARAHDFIGSLPNGYKTLVGDQGMRLSGGQRQRIALSRTILRDPDVLLLDEATNALDVESEQAFQLALEEYSHRRTVIVIAHRLSTVRHADHVIVLARGRVIESGTPDDLLDHAGHFARMYNLQHGERMLRSGSRDELQADRARTGAALGCGRARCQ